MRNKLLLLKLSFVLMISIALFTPNRVFGQEPVTHEFSALCYMYTALEPYIDATTMELHHGKHHRAYYDNFMKAIAGTKLETTSMEDIFKHVSQYPLAVRNNGGGYYNHTLFWRNLSPEGGDPSDQLATAIINRFGSFETFKSEFGKAALSLFGSGWVWLIVNDEGELDIVTTPNQDNPLMDVAEKQGTPLLTLDVWEHAYYLNYQNRRAAYVDAFWNIVNWNEVNYRLESSQQ